MPEKMIVYYDLTVWEQIEIGNIDELKDRCMKIAKMLEGLGMFRFNIRTESMEQPPKQLEDQIAQQPRN